MSQYSYVCISNTDTGILFSRSVVGKADPTIWSTLHSLWEITSNAHLNPYIESSANLDMLCLSIAKFTRNLVACNSDNQQAALSETLQWCLFVPLDWSPTLSANEPSIRKLIYHYTSFSVMKEPSCQYTTSLFALNYINLMCYILALPVTRMLVQTLSNIITSNETLIQRVWNLYLTLPEEQLILTWVFGPHLVGCDTNEMHFVIPVE